MNKLITLEDYKNYLIGFYTNKCDEDKTDERTDYINKHYSNEYLSRIVNNTEKFLLEIIKDMLNTTQYQDDKVWCKKEVSTYVYKDITNGCSGGWHADTVFCADERDFDYLVSTQLIKSFFGSKFHLDVYDDLTERYDEEDDIGSIDCTTYLYIVGPKELFLELVNSKIPEEFCLVKK